MTGESGNIFCWASKNACPSGESLKTHRHFE